MRRFDSWKLREDVREHPAATLRQKACGSVRYSTHVELRRAAAGGTAWWHGVIQCRARMCPVCWIARRYKAGAEVAWCVGARERETAKLAKLRELPAPQSYLITLTVRHSASDPVSIVRDVRSCWRSLIQSRAWRKWAADHGVQWICAEEVTRGDNGWHPHLHVLAMPEKKIDPRDSYSLSGLLFMHWARTVARRMGEQHAPQREAKRCRHCGSERSRLERERVICAGCDREWQGHAIGVDFRPCDAAGYLTKLGYELADPAAQKGAAPLALLEGGSIDHYMELQETRHRARDITYSRGLKGVRDARPDGESPITLLGVRGSDWGRMRAIGWDIPLEVADASESERTAREAIEKHLGKIQEPEHDNDHARWEK